ncbi:MAG: flagellar hook-associated protein FlgK [Phycisphaeraceae bacterium]|nr:flagellar hook-associated protein FlgK [Phycisphaeraceae bacterium]
MGLTTALQIGRSALNASQIALQVTGNNFANAATPGYSRQIATLAPSAGVSEGGFILGRGVFVQDVRRQTDAALLARLNSSVSHESAAGMDLQLLSRVESVLNELTDSDISSELSRFFNAWSELANSPGSAGARSLVVQQGSTLASFLRTTRSDLVQIRNQLDSELDANVSRASDLLSQIAGLNSSIVAAEGGSSQANSLRDQRDSLVLQLSQYLDISTVEQANGTLDVLVGSTPVVQGGRSLGLQVRRESDGTQSSVRISTIDSPRDVTVHSGTIGSLVSQRGKLVDGTIDSIDTIASQLIFQVNKIHSVGYGATPMTSIRGTQNVPAADLVRSLNDPANSTFAALPFAATNGGFSVTVTNSQTGATQTVRIPVDLDGIDNSGQPGFANDTSVQSLAASLGSIANLSATTNPDGTLSVSAATGYSFSFSDDSSGVLAVLGVNSYFTGTTARDIDVRQDLSSSPQLLSAGAVVNGQPNDNASAMGIAALQDAANAALGGQTIRGAWTQSVQSIGARTAEAQTRSSAATLVRQNLDAQKSAISGVSVDEESINLINYQRQYQGAARFISAVDELTQILINLIR